MLLDARRHKKINRAMALMMMSGKERNAKGG